jgi:Zinc finger, C2H2 type
VIPSADEAIHEEKCQPTTYQVTIPARTRSQRVQEKVFDDLKLDQRSNRSFDFEENHELYEVTNSSDEDIPARDVDNSDWPSSETLRKIPSKLIDNGLLLYKGKKLMQMMSAFYNTTCEMCGGKFRRISDLFEHYKSQHSVDPFVTCCSSKLSKKARIIWHFVKHIQPESFKCHICSYVVSRPKFLQLHLQTHTDSKPFSCDKCDKRFIWKGALKSHLINHQPESERKSYICPQCNRKYQTAGSLASHKKSAHGEVVKSKNLCEVCSKSFSTLTSYKEHMITHSEDSEKLQLKCGECGKWLKNQRCLKSHMQLHANVDHKCEMCDYVTKKEKLLKNHIITRHTNDRPWNCDACDKTFKVKRALTIHKTQNHAESGGKTGRTCEFCSREFQSSTNYYTHRKNLHAAELQQMLDKKKEEEKKKRIEIGLE